MLFSKVIFAALTFFGAILPHTLAVRYDSGVINKIMTHYGDDIIVVNDNFEICDVDIEVDFEGWVATGHLEIDVTFQSAVKNFGARRLANTLCDAVGEAHVVFDDDGSPNPIGCSSNLVNDGSAIQPAETLDFYNGLSSQGNWRLDLKRLFFGTLNQWALILTPCTNSPTASPTDASSDGAGTGDPHFKTWANKWYDFHGECDLVFISNPKFSQGTGLEIHIRTKARFQYSFIESAAVQIGTDILEVGAYGGYMLNGISNAELDKMDKYTVSHEKVSPKQDVFTIELGKGKQIVVQSFKDLVSVKTVGASLEEYGDSMGLLGEFGSGKWLARNGTVISKADAFGMEWQILESEPKLFQTQRSPQWPMQCTMPNNEKVGRRGLGESIAEAAAEKACEHWGDLKDQCVYDVMAAGDLELAEAGAF
ncbi:expressed unknown protein [Seminavis robusta]|uniref:VWFD domain-containing protein n=1 Tax=Seminavis robusta TaxID=568900 RepID=A0A9N8HFD7_9STRA|nr:expressed unknown protein [Seminavis robusta]|eukprot:Sro430_g141361.1  (423) ;mRNA; f:48554-49822